MGVSASSFSCLSLTYSRIDGDTNVEAAAEPAQAPLKVELLRPSHTNLTDQSIIIGKIEKLILAATADDDDVVLDCAAVIAMLSSLHFIDDVNALLFSNNTNNLLHFAITTKNASVVKSLLAFQIFDINCLNADSYSCLRIAHEMGNEEIVEEIMRYKNALANNQSCPQLNSVSSVGTESFATPHTGRLPIECFSPREKGFEDKNDFLYISLQDLTSRCRSRASSSAPHPPGDQSAVQTATLTTSSNDDFTIELDTVGSCSEGSSAKTTAEGQRVAAFVTTMPV